MNKDFKIRINKGEDLGLCKKSDLTALPWNRKGGVYEAIYRPDIHYTEIVSPLRRIYERDNDFISGLRPEPECTEISIPSRSTRVEFSRFFFTPHEVSFAAEYDMEVEKEGLYPFSLHTCSLIKIYLDGMLVITDFNSMRIIEKEILFSLHLTKGRHVVKIVADDLAERDSQLYVRLTYLGEDTLFLHLPKKVDFEKISYVRDVLDSLYLDRQNYSTSDVNIIVGKRVREPLDLNITLSYPDSNAVTESSSKKFVIDGDTESIPLSDMLFKPFGLISVCIEAEVEGCRIASKLDAEYYTINIKAPDTIEKRKKEALKFYAKYGNKTFQTLIAKCLVENHLDQEIFNLEMEKMEEHYDCSDFRFAAIIYAMKNLRHFFSAEQLERMKEMILNFRYWSDEYGTDVMWYYSENHALNFHVSELLAGELYPDEMFSSAKIKGSEHVERAEKRLDAWFDNFEKNGFIEWNSSVYIPIDLIAIISIVICSENERLVTRAKKILDSVFTLIAENSFKGVMSSSYGRIYFKNLIGRRLGEISALNWIFFGEGYLNQNAFAMVLFCLSSYEPGEDIIKRYEVKSPTIFKARVNPLSLDLYSYKTPKFILSTALNRKEGEKGNQEHLIHISVCNPDCQIWINHPGELAPFGEGRPSYFAGSLLLPTVAQDENRAELRFGRLTGEAGFTHAYVPLLFFDDFKMEGNHMYVRKEDVYVYLSAKNGLELVTSGPFKNMEIRSYGDDDVWRVWISEGRLGTGEIEKLTNYLSEFIQRR